MSYYQRHIFFCLNQRDNGEDACAQHGAKDGFDRCKARVKAEAGEKMARIPPRAKGVAGVTTLKA